MKKIKLVFAISITIALVFISIGINEVNSYLYAFIGISATWSWFNHESNISELKEMYEIEVEYNLKQRDKIDALKLEVDEKYQELSLLRQKYSRTNQPRSGGKFTPIIVKKGDKYMCKKDVDMGAYIAFSSGQLYISEHDRCITNNNNNEWHTIGSEFCKKHFKLIEP